MKMKIKGWKQIFPAHILERGKDYYLSGAVKSLDRERDSITAEVMGSESYEVELTVRDGKLEDAKCSCPYAEDGDLCKHMAAVLFRLTEEDADEEPAERKRQPNRAKALERQIASLNEAKAKELLLQLALKNPGGAELIEAAAAGTVSAAQVKRWEQEIHRMSGKYEDQFGGMDSDDAWEYADELTDLLDERIPLLLASDQPMEAFSLICAAASEAAEAELYEEDDGIGSLFDQCLGYWYEVIRMSDAEQRKKQYDWFARIYIDDEWEFGMEALEEILFEGFPDEALQREILTVLDRKIAQSERLGRSWALEHAIHNRLRIMEKLGLGREETDRFLEAHYAVPKVRKWMIRRALEEKEYDRAISLLKESRELDWKYSGLVREHQEMLIDLYRQLGRTEEQRAEALIMLQELPQRDLKYIKMLKDLTPGEDWPTLREELLTWESMKDVINLFLEEEKLYGRLFERVMERGRISEVDRFSASLWPLYPEQLMSFYLAYLRQAMQQASTRNAYAELVRRLKGLNKRPKGKEETARLAQEWRADYPRRRAMLDELAKAGF